MRHLFSRRGDAALANAMRRRPLLTFDFDGTLAPIVARPDDARVPGAVAALLAGLGARLPVAIVTGRAVADVRGRLGFVPQFIVGNHGAEDDAGAIDPQALTRALDPLRELLLAHAASLDAAGVRVEDKGLLIRQLTSMLPATLHVFAGKMVVNATASHAPDKAEAVRRLQARSGASFVFFVGDDVNDEPVFAAARRQWLTVRVGRDDRTSQARYFLDGVHEMPALLERMLAHLPAPPQT
jgi:trehalose 6-phosphate phosphatase